MYSNRFILVLLALQSVSGSIDAVVNDCDVIVAGGSLASFAAAISAANASKSTSVCFLEITDWPGGQATAGGTSAIDFGSTWANFPFNVAGSFADMLTSESFGDASINPGGCTVSKKCFPPLYAVDWMMKTIESMPNLKVFLNTAVTAVGVDRTSGMIVNLTAVRRTPVEGTTGWEDRLSQALPDWYSHDDSARFTKESLFFDGFQVAIEGTEFGDVLVLSGVRTAQGIEIPGENGTQYDESCGQEVNVCFWMGWGDDKLPNNDTTPVGGDTQGFPSFNRSVEALDLALGWRRSYTRNVSAINNPSQGDIWLINEVQDLPNANIWLTLEEARQQVNSGWQGGLNLTAYAMAEDRAFALYWAMKNGTEILYPESAGYIFLNRTASGTGTGLSKMPYLRESRRSQFGIDGFRICHNFASVLANETGPGCWLPPNGTTEKELVKTQAEKDRTGFKWVDTVAIGSYGFDIHKFPVGYCQLPSYVHGGAEALPYYLPFRAMTSWDSPNLLVVGKNMAQSFFSNAVIRLHPSEWSSGVSAGAAASLMVEKGWKSTLDVYHNIADLQTLIASEAINNPTEWTL